MDGETAVGDAQARLRPLGFLLLGFFPSDIVTSNVTVGTHFADHGDPWWHVCTFAIATVLLLALPALAVAALGRPRSDPSCRRSATG